MAILNFSSEDLFSLIRKNSSYRRVVIIFTTTWCGACKKILSVFKQLLTEKKEKDTLLLQVDAEENPTLSQDPFFMVSVVPKTFVFEEGVLCKQLEGSTDSSGLGKFLYPEKKT